MELLGIAGDIVGWILVVVTLIYVIVNFVVENRK